jgi:hypothetical protein
MTDDEAQRILAEAHETLSRPFASAQGCDERREAPNSLSEAPPVEHSIEHLLPSGTRNQRDAREVTATSASAPRSAADTACSLTCSRVLTYPHTLTYSAGKAVLDHRDAEEHQMDVSEPNRTRAPYLIGEHRNK